MKKFNLFMVICLMLILLVSCTPVVVVYPIVSIKSEKEFSLSGSFFLGCGSITGTTGTYFVTYVKLSENTYKLCSYNVNNVTIIETSDSPQVKITMKGDYVNRIYSYLPTVPHYVYDYNAILYVPKGTIVQAFKL